MAINNAVMNLALRLLLSLRNSGEKVDHAVAFGRQRLAVDATYFSDVLKLDRRLLQAEFCEPFFAQLGLQVDSIDFSDYEKATHIANLAEDNGERFRQLGIEGRYDLVLDLGTSEHVVNPINSVVNAYRLAREGGYIVLNLPVAGWFNHGFFNFQPTFFTSISSEWLQLVSLTLFELELGENSRAAETRFVDPKRPIDLNRNISSFAVYRKRGGLDVQALTCRTVQEVYR